MQKKTEAIVQLCHPETFKQLKSFMGSIHHLNNLFPISHNCAHRSVLYYRLKKKFHFTLDETREQAFKNILEAVHNITENRHFVSGRRTRVVCNASRDGVECGLEQETPDGWATIAYASRFLNSLENKKYSVNELELLAAVWSIEHF